MLVIVWQFFLKKSEKKMQGQVYRDGRIKGTQTRTSIIKLVATRRYASYMCKHVAARCAMCV